MKTGKTLRVLMVLTNLRVTNGVASFAMNYYRNLNHDEIKMDFAIYQDIPTPYYDEIKKWGGQIYVLPSIKRIDQHIKCCKRILESVKYDVIHNNTMHIALPMMICAMVKRVPVRILHSHSAKVGFTKVKEVRNRVFLPLLKFTATHYVACSEIAGKGMFGNHKFKIIHNVINLEKYSFDVEKRNQIRQQKGVQDCFVLGSVGRISEEKNPFFAMDVFKIVAEKAPTARYWWIGSGPYDTQLADYVKKLGIEDRVRLLGSRNDVADLYQAMDCFFMPSKFEGLPLTAIEAQSMGLPCVLSSSVTREVECSSLIKWVSLSKNTDQWAKTILETRDIKRVKYDIALENSSFSDQNANYMISTMYKDYLKKN